MLIHNWGQAFDFAIASAQRTRRITNPRSECQHKARGVSPGNTLVKMNRARGAGDSRCRTGNR